MLFNRSKRKTKQSFCFGIGGWIHLPICYDYLPHWFIFSHKFPKGKASSFEYLCRQIRVNDIYLDAGAEFKTRRYVGFWNNLNVPVIVAVFFLVLYGSGVDKEVIVGVAQFFLDSF